MADPQLKLAVMIDADNASHRNIEALLDEIAKLGEANVRRVYGDFTSPILKPWTDIAAKHAISPHMAMANTKGKNASDIAMVIDAMDLLHSGRFDGFCLVTSDSDFTALALRLRENNITVYGFGEQKTPESFREACNRFIYVENLGGQEAGEVVVQPETPKKKPSDAYNLVKRAIDALDQDDGWVNLALLGSQLTKLSSDFDPRTYGKAKLSELLLALRPIEMRKLPGGTQQARVKPK